MRHIKRVTLLVLAALAGVSLASRLLAEASAVSMDVFFYPPIDLSTGLITVSSYDLEVRDYQVAVPFTTASQGVFTRTIGIEVDPSFDGSTSVSDIENAYWRYRWRSVNGKLESASQITESLEIQITIDELTEERNELLPVTECWNNDSCPEVEHVVRMRVHGSVTSLIALSLSPIVHSISFFNGTISRGDFQFSEPPLTPPGDSTYGSIDTVAHRTNNKVSGASHMHLQWWAQPPPIGPHGLMTPQYFWAPTSFGQMETYRVGPGGQDPTSDPHSDSSRGMRVWQVWDQNWLYEAMRNFEYQFTYEAKFKLSDTAASPGTYLAFVYDDLFRCTRMTPIGAVFCTLVTGYAIPLFKFWECDLPGCFKDVAYPAYVDYVRWGFGTAIPDQIRTRHYYFTSFETFPGLVHGTGDQDMDSGCFEPQLHWRTPGTLPGGVQCTFGDWRCSANSHANFEITSAKCPDGIDPIPAEPNPPDASIIWKESGGNNGINGRETLGQRPNGCC